MRYPKVLAVFALALLVSCFPPQRAWADPIVPGFTVETYATASGAYTLSFVPSGVLFAGNCAPTLLVPVWRIGVGGSPVTPYGASLISDPDGVLFDPIGAISGAPGSVLVASGTPTGGQILAIRPDESIVTLFGPSPLFPNPDHLTFDGSGRLLFTDFNTGRILASTGGFPTVLFSLPAPALDINVDSSGRIFTSATDGTIRIHSSTGTLLDGSFVTGLGPGVTFEFAPGGAFGSDLYVYDGRGNLLRVDALGGRTVVGTGFVDGDLAFGPDGALYFSETQNGRILRIAPAGVVPEPSSRALFVLGVVGTLGYVRWRRQP